VPFSADGVNSMLIDHHEILAVGAVLRAKMREEIDHTRYAQLYVDLFRELIDDIELRQVQRSPHVIDSESYYDTL